MRKHGGKREGAGKPAQFEKPMKRKEIMLPDEAIKFFLALGDGNFSEGVRRAWRSLTMRAADCGQAGHFQVLVLALPTSANAIPLGVLKENHGFQ